MLVLVRVSRPCWGWLGPRFPGGQRPPLYPHPAGNPTQTAPTSSQAPHCTHMQLYVDSIHNVPTSGWGSQSPCLKVYC